MSNGTKSELRDLAPSAKLVFTVLEYEGPLTQKRIAEETRLPKRTTRYALRELEEIKVIEKERSFADARQTYYGIA